MVLDTGLEGKILTSAGDNAIRWRYGERLEDLFEDHCDALRRAGRGGDLAVDGPAGRLTYDELDAAANRVARFLVRGLRVRPGDRSHSRWVSPSASRATRCAGPCSCRSSRA